MKIKLLTLVFLFCSSKRFFSSNTVATVIVFIVLIVLYNTIIVYNRIILYNRTISPLVLFIFIGLAFGVFDIIYFRLVLKALDIDWFLW